MQDYTENTLVVWTGDTGGLGGTYDGVGNVRLLYAAALLTAQTMNLQASGYSQQAKSSTEVNASSTMFMSGTSNILGSFNGTISVSVDYVMSDGNWKIAGEHWDYKVLNTSASGGETTFPEWQKVGSIKPTRRSTDWLHNFTWDYGGPGAAGLVYIMIAALGVSVAVTKLRGR